VAVVWRGDRETRQAATPQNNRYHRIFEELAALGIRSGSSRKTVLKEPRYGGSWMACAMRRA
jgi:hypothetical protein